MFQVLARLQLFTVICIFYSQNKSTKPRPRDYTLYYLQDVCARPFGALRPSRALMPRAPSELSSLISPDSKLPPKYIFVMLLILRFSSRCAAFYVGVGFTIKYIQNVYGLAN